MKTATSEYLRGMQACSEGKEHQAGQSREYDKGFAAQYEHEQVLTEISLQEARIKALFKPKGEKK
jgi:hypothetical protein